MSDKLKKFIAENEVDFDRAPAAGHFERFKKKQEAELRITLAPKKPWAPVIMRAAAIFVGVLGVSWLFYTLGKMEASNGFAQQTNPNLGFSTELVEAENFFNAQVETRKKEVLAYASSDSEGLTQIMTELEKLELQYLDLKEELAVNNNNERIVNAMIENYRSRLELLERLLKQLKKSNQLKQKHHDQIQA